MASSCSRWVFVAVLGLVAVVRAQQDDEGNRTDNVRSLYPHPLPRKPSSAPHATPHATPGAACPNNVCENRGKCYMLHGQPHCLCNSGFVGDVCQDLHLELSCDPDRMTFQVLKSALRELNMDSSVLHTSNPACKLLNTSELYMSMTLTPENHTLCGTVVQVNGSHLIYTNEVSTSIAMERSEVSGSMISRSSDIHIGFSCVYLYDRVVSLPFPLVTTAALVTFMVKEGKFNVTMTLHPTAEYLAPHTHPLVIPLNHRLYVQLQIHGHGPQDYFTLRLEECWATPRAEHGSTDRHLLITDGVANDSTVEIDGDKQSVSRFSLQMFRFVQHNQVYLHCRIWLCPHNTTHCQQQPKPGRQRRELGDPYRKVVSCGPVQLAGRVRSSVAEPDSGLGQLVLAGSVSAGIVLLILSSVGFAKAVKKITGVRKRADPADVEEILL